MVYQVLRVNLVFLQIDLLEIAKRFFANAVAHLAKCVSDFDASVVGIQEF